MRRGPAMLGLAMLPLGLVTPGRAGASAGTLEITPSRVDYGMVQAGSGKSVTITARNPTAGVVTVDKVTVSPEVFRATSDHCSGKALPARDNCQVVVAFSPIRPGSVSGAIRFETDVGEPSTAALIGTGQAAFLAPEPTPTTGGGIGRAEAGRL